MKISVIISLTVMYLLLTQTAYAAVSQSKLNQSITKAQTYYEGLYKDLGKNGAVVNEYYSTPVSTYTVRHGVIGGVYYYVYTDQATRAAQLIRFATKYGFNPDNDLHSYIWKNSSQQKESELYSGEPYKDCFVKLPNIGSELAYHSKVCKLGSLGLAFYTELTKADTLLQTISQLQAIEAGRKPDTTMIKDLEGKYSKLGYGMPICFFSFCGDVASTIRTAEFGELELRLGNMKYADSVATQLLKAQRSDGAIYFSYTRNGQLKDDKGLLYQIVNKVLGDIPLYRGFIPTNAESMNDALAFLMHYRCRKYGVCN